MHSLYLNVKLILLKIWLLKIIKCWNEINKYNKYISIIYLNIKLWFNFFYLSLKEKNKKKEREDKNKLNYFSSMYL